MPDVFLSYSSNDRAAADLVQSHLSAHGVDVFWDQEVPPGVDWDTWIRSKLTEAKVAVVLWSRTSVASSNVRHEAMIGKNANKLVPVMIDALTPEDFPMGLFLIQAIKLDDWRSRSPAGLGRLLAEVNARLNRPAAPPPPQRAAPSDAKKKAGSPVPAVIGALALVTAAAVGGWYVLRGDASGPALEAEFPPSAEIASAPAEGLAPGTLLSDGIIGRWTWSDQPCEAGPQVTSEAGRLVFTTPASRYVHVIEEEDTESVRTRVIEPEFVLGEQYRLALEYVASEADKPFNLIVENMTAGTRDLWKPCDIE
ncbi:TIR domain-containing protein [bacterium]|nr:TIR domain-containing protein [bacterium]